MEKRAMIAIAASTGLAAVGGAAFVLARRRRKPYTLDGKTVLITGGGRGLGFMLANEFAARGAHVAIAARDIDELDSAQRKLLDAGFSAVTFPCDITDESGVQTLVETVENQIGPVDILVNNAGIITVGPVEEMTREDWEQAMSTHFWGPLNLMNAVLPSMRARKGGRIVNISSIGGKIPTPHLLPYVASKFALTGLSEGMRAEVAKDGVTVTTVCPGLMQTGSTENAMFKGHYEQEYAWFTASDTMPGLSTPVDEAARQIVDACVRGDAEIILTAPAQFAARAYGLFPGPFVDAAGIVNRLLPKPGGAYQRIAGALSRALAPRSAVKSTKATARQTNQFSQEVLTT